MPRDGGAHGGGGSPSRAWSLSVRLGWRLAAVTLLTVLLAAVAVLWRAVETVHGLDDSALQSQAQLILSALPATSAEGASIALPRALVEPFRASDGDNVFLVYEADALVSTSDPAAAARLSAGLPRPMPLGLFRIAPIEGHPHGMLGLAIQAGPWRVAVLQGREQTSVLLESLTDGFLVASVWLLLPIGLAMILVAVITLERGLRPLRNVSAAASLVGPGMPGARLPVASLPREIEPLVRAVNDALARMEQALVLQRRFMAEAAHAMRTPLAVLTARLDLMEDQPGAEALRGDADRLARLVGQLLRMGRLEGLPLDVARPVDLRAVAAEAIAHLVPVALRDGIDIALDDGPHVPPVAGNHGALVLAVTNLVENALAHAPRDSTVDVSVGLPAAITVADRGPGVPAEDRQRIFERFERGPHARHGGAGLGLAIVAEIARAHGGTVRVIERRGGGSSFVLAIHGDRAPSHRLH